MLPPPLHNTSPTEYISLVSVLKRCPRRLPGRRVSSADAVFYKVCVRNMQCQCTRHILLLWVQIIPFYRYRYTDLRFIRRITSSTCTRLIFTHFCIFSHYTFTVNVGMYSLHVVRRLYWREEKKKKKALLFIVLCSTRIRCESNNNENDVVIVCITH